MRLLSIAINPPGFNEIRRIVEIEGAMIVGAFVSHQPIKLEQRRQPPGERLPG